MVSNKYLVRFERSFDSEREKFSQLHLCHPYCLAIPIRIVLALVQKPPEFGFVSYFETFFSLTDNRRQLQVVYRICPSSQGCAFHEPIVIRQTFFHLS